MNIRLFWFLTKNFFDLIYSIGSYDNNDNIDDNNNDRENNFDK